MWRKQRITPPSAELVDGLLDQAKSQPGSALGALLELYRPYLAALTAMIVDPRLKAKESASDLVQRALLVAYRRFDVFEGDTELALRQWLRGILRKIIRQHHRFYIESQLRSVHREVSIDDVVQVISLNQLAATESRSPRSEVGFREDLQALEAALKRLPFAYRQVILWRNYRRRSFKDIGARLDRSPDSARMLHSRAVRRLAREMKNNDEQQS